MKEKLYQAILMNTRDALLKFQQIQKEYQTGIKTKVTRQLKTIDDNVTEEQINTVCTNPEVGLAL